MHLPKPLAAPLLSALVLAGCPSEETKTEDPPAGMAGAGTADGTAESPAEARRSKIASLPMDAVIVTVDGMDLKRADLERVVAHRASQLGAAPDKIPPLVRDELEAMAYDALVRRALLYLEAKRLGLVASAEEVEAQKQKLIAAVPEGRTIDDVLKMMHSDMAGLEQDIEMDLSIAKLQAERRKTAPKVTEAEAKKIYEEQSERFLKNEQASVSHILVAVAPDATPDVVDAARQKAEEIRASLEGKDKAAFAQAAKEKSDDPKAKEDGGDQGWFERRARVPEYGDRAFALKEGELSKPFRTRQGFFVLRGQGVKKGEKMSFQEAQAKIVAVETLARRAETDKAFIEGLTEKATIIRHHEPLAPQRLAQPPGPPGPAPAMPGGGHGGGMPGMPGMPGGGGDHMQLPLPSKDNVLPGAPNPHAAGGGGASQPSGAASQPGG